MFKRMRRMNERGIILPKKHLKVVTVLPPPGPVMYDGANNSSTDYATLLATANGAPSPQVCSASTESYGQNAFLAFNHSVVDVGWVASPISFPQSLMVDRGLGNAVLVNKYLLYQSGWNVASQAKDWILQGSNTVGCTVADAKNVNGWVDLDIRNNSNALLSISGGATNWITFSCDTAYRFFRIRFTAAKTSTNEIGTIEIKLVAQAV